MDNVWIGGNGGGDSHVLKFTRAGEFLLQAGEAGFAQPNSSALKTTIPGWPSSASTAHANEMYLADGYGNKRVAVIDASDW